MLLSLCISVLAWSQGIVFEKGSWSDVLKKAKTTGKPILVDVFTTWCGPCKTMSQTVFVQEAVGAFFNKEYICYQVDAELGEGISLASKYTVNAYPSFLFFKSDGTLFARSEGSMSASRFIEYARSLLPLAADSRNMKDLEKLYQKDKNNPELIVELMRFRIAMGEDVTPLFDSYLQLLPDAQRVSEKIAALYKMVGSKLNIQSLACENLIKYQQELTPLLDKKAEYYLKDLAIVAMDKAAKNYDLKLLDKAIEVYGEDPPTPRENLKDYFYMNYYSSNSDRQNFILYARRYYSNYLMKQTPGSNGMPASIYVQLLLKGATYAFKDFTDPERLNEAITWVKRALEIAPKNQTAAYLLYNLMYKSGDLVAARAGMTDLLQTFDNPSSEMAKACRETLKKMYANQPTW